MSFISNNTVSRLIIHSTPTVDLPSEIACYGLPYGGLGFASHILTYWTIYSLGRGVRPLAPWRKVKYGRLDIVYAIVGLLVGIIMSALTMARCRHRWQLLVIAVWKFSMTLFNGLAGLHVAYTQVLEKGVETDQTSSRVNGSPYMMLSRLCSLFFAETEPTGNGPRYSNAFNWVLIYLPGMIAGFVGLVSLVMQNWSSHRLELLTKVFGGFLSFCLFLILFGGKQGAIKGLLLLLPGFALLCAIYSDWALGLMADNLAGAPSGDTKAVYWVYWVSKRLTMLSW